MLSSWLHVSPNAIKQRIPFPLRYFYIFFSFIFFASLIFALISLHYDTQWFNDGGMLARKIVADISLQRDLNSLNFYVYTFQTLIVFHLVI